MTKVRTFALLPICLGIAMLVIGLLFVVRAHSRASAAARLVGTWRLVSAGTIADGTFQPNPGVGRNPIGYLSYEPTGRACLTVVNPDDSALADPAEQSATNIAGSAVNIYCGTYAVQEDRGQVTHRPEGAEWPHSLGMDRICKFRLEGDRLILGRQPSGNGGEYQVTWERVPKLPLAD